MTSPEALAAHAAFLPFAGDTMARKVHREGVLLLGGGRALLMQIAHPMVARGVADHSRFRTDRVQRLLRTLRPMLAIVLGTKEQALIAAEGINRVHESVIGTGYAAKDPGLLLWVLATLIDTSVVVHERFVRPLSAEEKDAYYEDMRLVGSLLSIAPDVMPENIEALQAYAAGMCESLAVTDEARDIAEALFESNLLTWPLMRSIRGLTAGLVPEPLRTQFGLDWGRKRQMALDAASRASRIVVPRLPRLLKAPPSFLMPR